MKPRIALLAAVAAAAASLAAASPKPTSAPPKPPAKGVVPARADVPAASGSLFEPLAQVLQSPRCMNCHPAGDVPLQMDASKPHLMSVRRDIAGLGTPCASCHRDRNAPAPHQPPGAPSWRMPPAATPMVFQDKSPPELCRDLKDPAKNGKRSLEDLVSHVSSDALVLWAWSPGPGRTPPPLSHDAFSAAFKKWTDAGGPCP